MNCEMAQRMIALAAFAPANARPATPAGREPYPREPHGREPYSPDPSSIHSLGAVPGSAEAEYLEAMLDRIELWQLEHSALDRPEPGRADSSQADSRHDGSDGRTTESASLEAHLAACRACQAELAATAAFYRALSLTGRPEPTPSLLARARMRLDAALDNHAHRSALAHLLQQLSFSAGRLRASPGLASGLLILGLTAGGYAGYRAGHAAHNREQGALVLQRRPAIADVSSVVRVPDSEQVEVHYDRLEPETLTGSLDDPSIRNLLMFAMQNGVDPSVRTGSFELLADACRQGHGCNGGPIRNALLSVLHSDRSPQVRLEALEGLEPYIAEDMQVRDAVVRSMLADSNAEVRIEAIRLLTPVEVDSSVRQALHTVASHDGDPMIRNASQQMLNGIPAVQ